MSVLMHIIDKKLEQMEIYFHKLFVETVVRDHKECRKHLQLEDYGLLEKL